MISVQQQLQDFLLTELTNLDRLKFPSLTSKETPISLFRLPTINSITYRCAIAFQLSPDSPFTVAETIFNTLKQPLITKPDLCLNFTVKLLDQGWLDFTLCDRSLSRWLQSWANFSYPQKNSSIKSTNNDNFWIIQYTYARCCALLRLGEQGGLIQLKNPQFPPYTWSLLTPSPIPYFNLELNEIERSLISQIITTVDRLVNDSKVKEIKLALALSNYFLNFERYCRIFGEISRNKPQLSQVRLGLVAITHILLQGLWLSQRQQPLCNRL